MAGPAMIEGGGLGIFKPEEIGPAEMHNKNGHLDYLAENEEDGTNVAKKYFLIFRAKPNMGGE